MLIRARAVKSGGFPWPAALIAWGPGSISTSHSHHCIQLMMALRGQLRVREQRGKPWRRCSATLVRPDAQHEIDASNAFVLIAFIDPECELGAAFKAFV